MIKTGEEVIGDDNQHFRVVAVVPFDDEDESPFVGMRSEVCRSAAVAAQG
jgi:hypothetical protein